jgi:hypothetical protein
MESPTERSPVEHDFDAHYGYGETIYEREARELAEAAHDWWISDMEEEMRLYCSPGWDGECNLDVTPVDDEIPF